MSEHRKELESLYADRTPPMELEARVMRDFGEGRTATRAGDSTAAGRAPDPGPSWRRRTARALVATVAAAAVFVAGWSVGRADAPAGVALPQAPAFLLLLWEGPAFDPGPDPGALVTEYAEWARATRASGVDLSGAELGPSVRVGADPGVLDGSPRPAQPGGFFLVAATDLDQAERLAQGHPHLTHGGWIEVARLR